MTSQRYQMSLFEESDVWILSVEDFRAKLSQLRELEEVLKIQEELSSLKSQGSHACFIYEFVDELKSRTAEWQPLYLSYYKFEVIGNSLENPELLEVTE